MKDWKFHCAVMGLRENATPKEIRRAYRKLALLRHPDKHNNSSRAKEDFQLLNESYRYLMTAAKEGRRPSSAPGPTAGPAPINPQTYRAPAAKQNPVFNALAIRKSNLPSLHQIRPKNMAQVWMHSAVACFVVLLISLWVDQPESRNPASARDSRDLSLTAFCVISRLEAARGIMPESSEILPEKSCIERCNTIAKNRDISCSWDRKEFRSLLVGLNSNGDLQTPAPPAANIKGDQKISDAEPARCEVTVMRPGMKPGAYRVVSDRVCQSVCLEMTRSYARSEVICSWDKKEFSHQLIAKPAPETPVTPTVLTPSAISLPTYADRNPRSACFMSVVLPGDVRTDILPDETEASCITKCQREILAHPHDREVRCDFAGKSVVTFVPDPTVSYLARNPAQQQGIRQGNSYLATCELSVWKNSEKTGARASMETEKDCDSRCTMEYGRQTKNSEVACKFNGAEFFRKTAD